LAACSAHGQQSTSETLADAQVAPDAAASGEHWPLLKASQIGEPVEVSKAFTLAEGPIWDACGARLLFTDVTAHTIHALGANGKITSYFKQTQYANGLAFAADGALLMAEMGGPMGGRISRLSRTKQASVVVDQDAAGKPFNTTDDLVQRSDGTIYFTDPTFPYGPFTAFSLSARPVYRLAPGKTKRKLVQEATAGGPNGIELSPDEKTLYVAETFNGDVLQFDVNPDGSLVPAGTLVTGLASPDSMCVDAQGNVYVGVTSGLQVVAPDGTKLKLIPTAPAKAVTNCTFGGDDGKTLYITAWTTLFKVAAMPIPGLDWQRNQKLSCP
jgi:gluconolactonase